MWTNSTVLRLIELYRSYECLWDTTNDGYKNKKRKNELWEELAAKMEMSRNEVEMKIHGVRSQYLRERKKRKQSGGKAPQSLWFAYEPLSFLMKLETGTDTFDNSKNENSQDSQSCDSELQNNQTIEIPIEEQNYRPKTTRKRPNEDEILPPRRYKTDSDEFDIYGQYIASELRNVKTEHEVLMAKYHINNVIFDARMGKFNSATTESASQSYSQTVTPLIPYRISSRPYNLEVNNDSNSDVELFVKTESGIEEN